MRSTLQQQLEATANLASVVRILYYSYEGKQNKQALPQSDITETFFLLFFETLRMEKRLKNSCERKRKESLYNLSVYEIMAC